MTWGNELYKGYGYRLHSGRNSGKIVAVKVYEGDHAREVSPTYEDIKAFPLFIFHRSGAWKPLSLTWK